ncbi:MAG: ribonuclease III [bacterium]|nr:ribonuclease III [bacterium]
MDFSNFEKGIGYKFKKKELLQRSLTHRSYLNENPSWQHPHNERLEFLGDAVLELAVTEELFNRYPNRPEGEMTSLRAAMVNTISLSEVGHNIELNDALLMSKGEARDLGRGREAILADGVEAVIGAIYLDGGYEKAKNFILDNILVKLSNILAHNLHIDAKSHLQERVQAERKLTPHYSVISEEGPDHDKQFTVGVYFGKDLITEGAGHSKHEAEVEAARKALEKLEEI